MLFRSSIIETFYADEMPSDRVECEVRIGAREIAVSMKSDDGHVLYLGHEVEPGHFELACEKARGRAVLHRLGESNTLEGYWVADGSRGMCQIELDDPGEINAAL